MTILANDFKRLWDDCAADVQHGVTRVGASGWYVLGGEVQSFETALSTYADLPHVVGCGNGMDAIEIALRCLDIGVGDKVLTTSLSAFATGLAILRAGAEPVYCDVGDDGLMDPDAVKQALEIYPDIRAIVPVHLFGHMADMAALRPLADAAGAVLIEDAAQAIGASRNGVRMGALSRASCTSFYPTKNLGAIGDGGALLTADATLAETALSLRNYGQTEKYVHDNIGLNSRLDELQAAILSGAFLPRLQTWTDRRRAIARRYLDGITHQAVTLCPGADPEGAVWHLFPVLVPAADRAAFMAHLGKSGVQAGIHYPKLIHHQKAMTQRGSVLCCGDLPKAQEFADCEVSLPIHPYLSDSEVDQVIAAVNGWVQ